MKERLFNLAILLSSRFKRTSLSNLVKILILIDIDEIDVSMYVSHFEIEISSIIGVTPESVLGYFCDEVEAEIKDFELRISLAVESALGPRDNKIVLRLKGVQIRYHFCLTFHAFGISNTKMSTCTWRYKWISFGILWKVSMGMSLIWLSDKSKVHIAIKLRVKISNMF